MADDPNDYDDPAPEQWWRLSVAEVAAVLGLSPRHVLRLDAYLGPRITVSPTSGRKTRSYRQENLDNFRLLYTKAEIAKALRVVSK